MVVLRNQKVTEPGLYEESKTKDQETHLITGARGHAGFWLGKRLAAAGHRVILVDLMEPIWTLKPGMEFHKVRVITVRHIFLKQMTFLLPCNYQLSKSIVHEIKFGDIAVI